MYGSTHTHFESRFDTANDLTRMILEFNKLGAKKVAVTEHGVFSSFEDLKDIVTTLKSKNKISNDFEIIPGVEGYFGEKAAHLILIAKDYEGYLSLCKIISEANENFINGKAIITEENLEKNVSKGHIFCTSACIGGPFGHIFGLDEYNLKEKIDRGFEKLNSAGYFELIQIINEYESQDAVRKSIKAVGKGAIEKATKIFTKTGDRNELNEIEAKIKVKDDAIKWMNEHQDSYQTAAKALKDLGNAKLKTAETRLNKAKSDLVALQALKETGFIENKAEETYQFFIDTFGINDFYFEIQNHGINKEKDLYNKIVEFAVAHNNYNFIASNDIHIGVTKNAEDFEEQLNRRDVVKFNRFNTYTPSTEDEKELYIKDDDELKEALLQVIRPAGVLTAEGIIDKAIANIEQSLSECQITFPEHQNHYPKFCDDENAEFERLVREGVKKRFPNGFPRVDEGKETYEDRLEREIDVIKTMGYAGYHLIVQDYLEYGRLLGYLKTPEEIENAPETIEELDAYITAHGYERIGYSIGPGRGSAAGSLCCYVLGITDIDPLMYDLLFERFLNVERVSMPDIDSDFRTDIRAKVEDYCRTRYGKECICKIMTKSYGSIKGDLRLAARYMGTKIYEETYGSLAEKVEELTEYKYDTEKTPEENETLRAIFEKQDVDIDIEESEPELKEFLKAWYNKADKLSKAYDANKDEDGNNQLPDYTTLDKDDQSICELAKVLDGVFLNYGQHAAGTIISADDVRTVLPLMWNGKKGSIETQCTMAQAEAKGLLKMDFLGLDNLNTITDILQHPLNGTSDYTLQSYDARNAMLQDPEIYKRIFWEGLTQGVFQFESPGMKKMLKEFKPESFEDIILLVAAYRPGPLDYIPEIIATKWYERAIANGEEAVPPKKSITLNNQTLQEILTSTYGCPIYQEQIMQIFQQMAGYTLGRADDVRRAMSKKKVEKLAHEKPIFIHGNRSEIEKLRTDGIPEDKLPKYIPGCMELQHITEQEADELFEQMMPFAKYGFNKSHATAYAMVSMFTAYQKVYHTADFFKATLNANRTEFKNYMGLIQEMSKFGLEFRGPSMIESQNLFTIEPDEKGIRFGLKKIKGFSEQNVGRDLSIQGFMEKNQTISLKLLENYAKLGMFQETWAFDKKTGRLHGNRHECLKWIKDVAPTFQKYLAAVEKTDKTEERLLNAEKALMEDPSDETNKEYDNAKKAQQTASKRRKELASELNNLRVIEKTQKDIQETISETLENRKWEVEMLTIPFDIKESFKRVKNCYNKKNFNNLLVEKAGNYGKNTVQIPAIVLSISEEKKVKKSGRTYYDVTLMDGQRNIITRRFSAPPEVLDGIFSLTLDECKYYTCELKDMETLQGDKKNTQEYSKKSNPQKWSKAFSNGGQVKQYNVPGQRTLTTIQMSINEQAENEKDEFER